MRIGVDIDNVLSNFSEELLREYIIHDKEINGNGIVNKNECIRKKFNWTDEEEKKFYKENIERISTNLKPIKNCAKYIRKLKEIGCEIYIITGRDNGDYSDPYNMTVNWLKKYNIYYDKIFFVNAKNSHSKTEVCLENNISIMIDDSKRLCLDMIKHGITTFIIDTPYNKDVDGSVRVHNWKEIYDNIKKYSNRMNVILDTDIYNEADDLFALSYLLKSRDMFNIEAITTAPYLHKNSDLTVKEGQDLSYNEILKLCNLLNFNSENKVFKGSLDYIQNGYDDENEAVNEIIEIALKNDMTYVFSIGAITNIALAIKKEPKIINKIEIIWLGGNDISYKDNMEYNFRQDVEAVKIVFNSNVKLTVLPCKNVVSTLKIDINTLKDNLIQNELNNYLIERFCNDGYHPYKEERVIWDISVIAYMINKKWFKTKEVSTPVINDDTSYKMTNVKNKIIFVTKLNRNKIYSDLFKKLGKR